MNFMFYEIFMHFKLQFIDPLYEVTQKMAFLLSILLGCLNIPFLIEVIILHDI